VTSEDFAEDRIEVAPGKSTVLVRVRGRARFARADALRQFASRMLEKGARRFCVDLSGCASVDSTFIGTLAMIATEERAGNTSVHVVGASNKLKQQFSDLGVARVFQFEPSKAEPCSNAETGMQEASPTGNREQLQETMLRAHEKLAELSPDNKEKFRDVMTYLRDEEAGSRKQ
jgi:anti-anti-sigma factor